MPDREHDNLQRELGDLGSRIEYPPTPDIARTVRRRLDEEAAQPPGQRGMLRTLARPRWAAAAAIVLLCLTALSPALRSNVLDSASSFGSGGAAGGAGSAEGGSGDSSASSQEYAAQGGPDREGAPGGSGAAGGSAASGSSAAGPAPGADLGFGERLSPSEARGRVGGLLLPENPELSAERAAIYSGGPSAGDGVVLVFGPGPGLPPLGGTDVGLLLAEVPGELESVFPAAGGPSGPPEEVEVSGRRGYWMPDGRTLRSQPGEAENLTGGALLWERGGLALLIRADVTKEEAMGIAGTIR